MKLLKMLFLVLILISPAAAQRSMKVTPPTDLIKFLGIESRDVEVKAADLNGDGQFEYFVKKIPCESNCSTALYQRRGNKFIELISLGGLVDVFKGSQNGMRNVAEYSYQGYIGDFVYTHYRWDGQDYTLSGCTVVIKSGKYKGQHENVECAG